MFFNSEQLHKFLRKKNNTKMLISLFHVSNSYASYLDSFSLFRYGYSCKDLFIDLFICNLFKFTG